MPSGRSKGPSTSSFSNSGNSLSKDYSRARSPSGRSSGRSSGFGKGSGLAGYEDRFAPMPSPRPTPRPPPPAPPPPRPAKKPAPNPVTGRPAPTPPRPSPNPVTGRPAPASTRPVAPAASAPTPAQVRAVDALNKMQDGGGGDTALGPDPAVGLTGWGQQQVDAAKGWRNGTPPPLPAQPEALEQLALAAGPAVQPRTDVAPTDPMAPISVDGGVSTAAASAVMDEINTSLADASDEEANGFWQEFYNQLSEVLGPRQAHSVFYGSDARQPNYVPPSDRLDTAGLRRQRQDAAYQEALAQGLPPAARPTPSVGGWGRDSAADTAAVEPTPQPVAAAPGQIGGPVRNPTPVARPPARFNPFGGGNITGDARGFNTDVRYIRDLVDRFVGEQFATYVPDPWRYTRPFTGDFTPGWGQGLRVGETQ